MTKTVCGDIKTTYDCLDGLRGQCPQQVATMEETMNNMLQGGPKSDPDEAMGMPIVNFGYLHHYMRNECPKVPAGFLTNSCVKQKLNSRKFQKCYSNVTQEFNGQFNSCPVYFAIKKCIEASVGSCGKAETNAAVQSVPAFLGGIPSNCEGDIGDIGGMGGGSADGGKGGMGSPEPSDDSQSGGDGDTGGSGGIHASVITLIVASASLIALFH